MKFKLNLPKKLWLAVAFLVATAFVFITQVSFATPKPSEDLATPIQQPQGYEDSPCYFQTQQGTTLNLSKLCGATTPTSTKPARPTSPQQSSSQQPSSQQSSSQQSRDYDYQKIKNFDDSLYGRSDEVYGQQ